MVGGARRFTSLFTVIAVLTLLLYSAIVFGVTDSFSASATVNDQAPTIVVDEDQSVTGAAANTAWVVYVFFNATDTNGNTDLNLSAAQVILSRAGNSDRTSSSCTNVSSPDANTFEINCSVAIAYYDEAGAWDINATIEDNSGNYAENASEDVTFNNVDSVTVDQSSIAFTGNPGTNDIASSPEPQRLNNTGNQDYTSINITGFEFASSGNFIGVGNVTINVTDSNGPGQVLINNTEIVVFNASLSRGELNNQSMYFWLDIPASTSPGTYNVVSNWILEAII